MNIKQIKSYIDKRMGIESSSYSFRKELLDKHECIERNWLNSEAWKNKHGIEVKDDDTITFAHCLRTEFVVKHNQLLAYMTVYSHGQCGYSSRCELIFIITKSCTLLKNLVMEYVENEAELVIQKEDEEILRQRRHKAKLDIMRGL